MELHPPATTNKLWDYLKAVFFMLKVKSLISKKRFQMDINLFMRRGKFISKSITNLLTITHHHSNCNRRELVSLNLHAKRGQNYKRGYLNLPCVNASAEEGEDAREADRSAPLRLEHASQELDGITTSDQSPFAVRVSDFSLPEQEDGGENGDVDYEAEEFIRRFYEELKGQSQVQ